MYVRFLGIAFRCWLVGLAVIIASTMRSECEGQIVYRIDTSLPTGSPGVSLEIHGTITTNGTLGLLSGGTGPNFGHFLDWNIAAGKTGDAVTTFSPPLTTDNASQWSITTLNLFATPSSLFLPANEDGSLIFVQGSNQLRWFVSPEEAISAGIFFQNESFNGTATAAAPLIVGVPEPSALLFLGMVLCVVIGSRPLLPYLQLRISKSQT